MGKVGIGFVHFLGIVLPPGIISAPTNSSRSTFFVVKTNQIQKDIENFAHKGQESLAEASERFQQMSKVDHHMALDNKGLLVFSMEVCPIITRQSSMSRVGVT